MRTQLLSTCFAVACCVLIGRGFAVTTQPAATEAPDAAAHAKTFVMQAGGADVLKVDAADDVKCLAKDGLLHFNPGAPLEVELWLVPGALKVDETIHRVAELIKSEFTEFKSDNTSEMTVAGASAVRLTGRGHEADDGDPGEADVILFTVGGRVFVACTHGETLNPQSQQAMVAIVQSAQRP